MANLPEVLKQTFAGIVYLGRYTLRHEDEPTKSDMPEGTDYEEEFPECFPHVFIQIDSDGVSFYDALTSPSAKLKGSSGTVVQYQKLIRDGGNTLAQVEAWRDQFEADMLDVDSVHNFTDENLDEVLSEINSGEPFVILKYDEVALDVPKQPEDMRDELRNIFEMAGTDPSIVDQKEDHEIRRIYEQMQNGS